MRENYQHWNAKEKSKKIASAVGNRFKIQNVIDNLKYWLNIDGMNLNTEERESLNI